MMIVQLWPGRFPGIAGHVGNHGNDGKFHKTVEEEIAKKQVKINGHMELEKKIEHSVEELWKLAEGTGIENKWYQVGKKGKVIDLQEQSEHLKENQTSKELDLVIFGDSIMKFIIPENAIHNMLSICRKAVQKSRLYTSS